MSISSVEIAWIAGLLEGEGTFRIGTTPLINIAMTDLDTIEKFRILTKVTHLKLGVRPKEVGKTQYVANILGNLAIQWMMTIYPLMSIRRKEKIKDVIEKWKDGEYTKKMSQAWRVKQGENITIIDKRNHENQRKRKTIKAIAVSRNISMKEAEKILDDLMSPEGVVN